MSYIKLPRYLACLVGEKEKTLYVWEDGKRVLGSIVVDGFVTQCPIPYDSALDLYLVLKTQFREGLNIKLEWPPYEDYVVNLLEAHAWETTLNE